jgi:hypothetical protein
MGKYVPSSSVNQIHNTGVRKSRFTVVRMGKKRHAGYDYYNSFINLLAPEFYI